MGNLEASMWAILDSERIPENLKKIPWLQENN